jgi:hypothetical protein
MGGALLGRTVVVVVSGALTMAAFAGPAAAGGWWSYIDLQSRYLTVGETKELHAGEVLFRSLAEARRVRLGEEQFHVFLIPGFDWRALEKAMGRPNPRGWWERPPSAVPAGSVRLTGWNGNLASAHATISVPSLEAGEYALMLCSDGCAQPLGNLTPARVTVSASAATTQVVRTLDRLSAEMNAHERALRRVDRSIGAQGTDLEELDRNVQEVRILVRRLFAALTRERLTEAPARTELGSWILIATSFIAGLLVAAALLAVRRRLRHRRADALSPALLNEGPSLAEILGDPGPHRQHADKTHAPPSPS